MNTKQSYRKNIFFWGLVGLLIIGSYGWRLRVFHVFPFSYDEGIHLMLGKLWAAGYIPYREIFVSYPPLFMWSLGLPWEMFSHPYALQFVMTTYALAGVLAVVYLGTAYHSRLAGLAAGLFLSFTPAYFVPSFSIMTEVPSISLAVAAIGFAEKYRRSGGWPWILLAGASLGLGLSLKILPYYGLPLVGLMVLSKHVTGVRVAWQPLIRNLAILAAGFIATFFVPLIFYDIAALYKQAVEMRLVSREVAHNPFDSNNEFMVGFLFGNSGLTVLALYGLVFVAAKNLRQYWPVIVWFALIWASMYLLVPLRDKHLPIFIPALALLAGFAVEHMVAFLAQVKQQALTPKLMAMLLTILLAAGMFVWNVPLAVAQNNGATLQVSENKERQAAIQFINAIARPDDCVIADNPVFLYQTNRLPPPELSETSQTRVDTGYLTTGDVIESIQKYHCHVVAVVTPRFGESLPGLPEWLAQHYLGLYAQSETFVYFAPKGNLAQNIDFRPAPDGSFGGLVRLSGYHLSRPTGAEPLYISLYWLLESPIKENYVEQITLRRATDGAAAFQMERPPFEGKFNPAAWHINEAARDTFRLYLPAELPAGKYNLHLSLCAPETGQCLEVGRGQTELFLEQIELNNP